MGSCFQCYQIFTKNNNITSISPSNNPPVVIDTEIIPNNNSNTHIIKINPQKKQNTLNHGTTTEKNEPSEENVNEIIPKKESNNSKKPKNLLSLNTNKINKRPGTVNTENSSQSNKKYNKLQSFTRQLSTESFLRAKTKGDKIIDTIPKHLGPRQISWDEGGFKKFLENKNAYSNSGNSNSLRKNIYLKKITEANVIQTKKSNRLSVIKEDEIEEERKVSITETENIENERNNKLINKIKNVNLFKNNLDNEQIQKLSLIINEYEIQPEMDIFCKGEIGSSYFILDEGEIKIYDDDPKKFIKIKNEYNFGEIGLVSNEDIRRNYNITTLTKTKLFILDIDKFNSFLQKQDINIKALDINYFKNIEFFQHFPDDKLYLLSKFCYIVNENEINNNKKDKDNYYINLREFFNLEIKSCLQKYFIKFEIFNNAQISFQEPNSSDEINKNNNDDDNNLHFNQYLII